MLLMSNLHELSEFFLIVERLEQCVIVLALDLEGVHDVKLHHPSSYVATSNQ